MIFLVRHGEAAQSWGNHPDPGLSALGHKQAASVAADLAERGAMGCLTSPMQRCRETAQPFEALLGASSTIAPDVSEIATPDKVADRVEWLHSFMSGTWDKEGSEHTEWRDRMVSYLHTVPDQTVVFSHFIAINAVASKLMGKAETVIFKPGHCSVTVLAREKGQLKIQNLGSESATRVL